MKKILKVLFFTPNCEDYISDSVLHGFKSLSEFEVIDFPKQEILYNNCPSEVLQKVRGNGFTLYSSLCQDQPSIRFHLKYNLQSQYFDLVIFGDIWRTFGYFVEFHPYLSPEKTIMLDGADTPQPYPYAGKFWRYPPYWFLPKAHKKFLYFKREWTPDTVRNLWYQLPPHCLCPYIPSPRNFRPISFSIPEEKIVKSLPVKTKMFPKHIVDPDVASKVEGSVTSYAFDSEAEYYADLQASKFGITTKRSGWDCLRHYEIAANGCVPCFRDLNKKPTTCAPHGLNETNCIIYSNYDDLMTKINSIDEDRYHQLQANSLQWARENTTIERAKKILKMLN